MFFSLIPLAVAGGIIFVIVRALSGRDDDPVRPADADTARRLFAYIMVFAALIVCAIGLAGLLGRALTVADARSSSGFAATLALTLVGAPVFVGLARWSWQRLEADRNERNAVGWTLYLAAALVVSLTTAAGALIGLAARLIDGSGYDGNLLATLIVWGAVWIVHWYAWQVLPPGRGAHLHLLIGSAIGLTMFSFGIGFALSELGQRIIDSAADVAARGASSDEIATNAIVALVGAAIWVWHWLAHGVKLDRRPTWLAYVLLYGVLGGLAASLAGAGRSIFLVLEWLFGDPETTSAVDHFRRLSPALAAGVIGLAVWRYHSSLVGPRRGRERTDVDRVYDAIVAGTSLATVAASIAILVVAVFRLADPAAATGGDGGGDVFLAAVTLLAIGAPLWLVTWLRMQRHAADGPEEATSTPRRSYLVSVLGVSAAVAFGALIRLLIVLFETWLGERSGGLADPLQWPVALLVTTGSVAWYHFLILRAERRLYERRIHRDILLVWGGNGRAGDIATSTHSRIRVLHRTDLPDIAIDTEAVTAAIEAAEGDHLVVVAGAGEVLVVPYD